MKILFINSLYYPDAVGGAEKSVQILAEEFVKQGHSCVVVTTSYADRVEYVNGVKVYYVKTPNLYWWYESKKYPMFMRLIWHLMDSYNFSSKKRMRKIVDVENPDIVHTNNLLGFSVSVWELICSMNIPIVHTLRDYYLLCWRSSMFKNNKNCDTRCFDCRALSFFKRRASCKIKAIVGVSKYMLNKHLVLGYFGNANIKRCIYNPFMPGAIFSPIPNKTEAKADKGIVFGFAGSISPSKGIEFILKIFCSSLKNNTLYIYGAGKDKKYAQCLKEKYQSENIIFMGHRPFEQVYAEIDVLLVPSVWNEPFGRVVVEAFSYGIPVLASDSGGIPEIIEDKKTGFLFTAGNEESFMEKIAYFLRDKNIISYMKENCIQSAKRYKPAAIAGKYMDLYKKF